MNKEDDEIFWFSLKMEGRTYLIGAVYRPDYCSLIDGQNSRLESHLHKAFQFSSDVILIGDLNVDLLHPLRSADQELNEKLCRILSSFGMYQLIKKPTRITHKTETLLTYLSYLS